MNTALILVDIQNDYFPGGKHELHHPEQAADHAKRVLKSFREGHRPIFHVQHISEGANAAFFSAGTVGAEIYQGVSPQPGEKVIMKHTPDSFFQTDLQQALEELHISKLVIGGMMTHMCIDTTVRSAKRLGYEIVLLDDACATKDLFWEGQRLKAQTIHRAFMAALQDAFAAIKTTDRYLEELLR